MIQKIKIALIKSNIWKKIKRELLKRKKFTSQIGQDKWVLEKTHFKRGGYFLDIGAADGLYLSNTYILEKKYGWKGICVEPANKIKDLKKNRRCIIENSCISSKSGEILDFQVDEEISGIIKYFDGAHKREGNIIKVNTISLKDLLKKYNSPKIIDFLSVDTEGSEYEILKNFPFENYEVKLITVEHNAHSGKKEDIKKREDIFNLLTKKGFIREPHISFSKKFGAKGSIDFEDWYVNKNQIKMNNYIISASQGGLSNRIKSLILSMKIASETNRELLLYWPKDRHCNCYFKDLFENKIKEISKRDLEKVIKSKDIEYYEDSLNKIKKSKKFILIENATLAGFTNKDIFLIYEKIPKKVKEEIIFYLKKLIIKKEILKIVNNFSSKRINKNTIGVHIRKGDFTWLRGGIGEISNEKQFLEEIKKEINEDFKKNFFLATEDPETEKRFKKLFGKKIITYPKKQYEREKEGSVEEALIELILLSKTKKILGTFGSTFTELSWFFEGCKPRVKIIINKENLRKFLEYKRRQNNSFNKIKKVIYELLIPKSKRIFRIIIK